MNRALGIALRGCALAATALAIGGCGGKRTQSALDPAGAQASSILSLGHLFFWICAIVYLLVVAVVVRSLLRARWRRAEPAEYPADAHPDLAQERRLLAVIGGATIVTTVLLFVLLAGDVVTGKSIQSLRATDAPVVTITARQWWWEVRYEDELPSQIVTTANEIHIPIGRPIRFDLRSTDVIHSFWVPNLHGKRDMIPGHPTSIWIKADQPGRYSGQCAEFCGLQHAHMRFAVIAEPPEQFEQWLEEQRRPAPEPVFEQEQRGRDVFMSTTCAMCHTIGGTEAQGLVGPNLTHVTSRATLAAGALPNRPGHLAGWIIDPQKIKPGARMPQHAYRPEELRDLLAYLETLK